MTIAVRDMESLSLCLLSACLLVPPLIAASACRALISAGHPDAPQGLALGKIPHHLMSISTHLYATQMPQWYSVIQSELIRSLILSGTPQALLTLTPSPASIHLQLQSAAASGSPTEGPRASTSDNSSLLLADGKVNWQGAKTASAQSFPVLLHQALSLALTADWGPADFGACETDSSDSSSSESTGSEQADDNAAQEAIAAAGHEKILAIAVMAVTLCCDKPALFKADESRANLGGLVTAPTNEVSLVTAPACL